MTPEQFDALLATLQAYLNAVLEHIRNVHHWEVVVAIIILGPFIIWIAISLHCIASTLRQRNGRTP